MASVWIVEQRHSIQDKWIPQCDLVYLSETDVPECCKSSTGLYDRVSEYVRKEPE